MYTIAEVSIYCDLLRELSVFIYITRSQDIVHLLREAACLAEPTRHIGAHVRRASLVKVYTTKK